MQQTKIYQVSDCHVTDNDVHRLIDCLHHIERAQDCDVLLLTGDIVCNPTLELYLCVVKAFEDIISCEHVFALAGNHDDIHLMKQAFKGSKIKITDKFNMGTYQLVFINSSDKPISSEATLGAGRVSKKELSKLKKMTRHKPSIVIIHHPIVEVGALWFKNIAIENRAEVLKSINNKVFSILCGHGHAFMVNDFHGGKQFMAPSTSYGFDHHVDEYKTTDDYGLLCIKIDDTLTSIKATPIYLNK
ncbi:metallophosphoesterase [Shewanella sp. VB17]|uniref:metallophosphoesterase family protein n=1 Tax=Shewanella sp. VB17 TaxID=2739432 RepID=UPI001563B146|nr:metallophosphoesterase [Shewanella sp. VB17]NRD75822.1 metallophosphoesterase [Shewanella sp. VB17]